MPQVLKKIPNEEFQKCFEQWQHPGIRVHSHGGWLEGGSNHWDVCILVGGGFFISPVTQSHCCSPNVNDRRIEVANLEVQII